MNVLVVWIEQGGDTTFVIFKNMTDDLAAKLCSFHQKFINSDAGSSEINEFFYSKDGVFLFEQHAGPIRGWQFDQVIITGIVL